MATPAAGEKAAIRQQVLARRAALDAGAAARLSALAQGHLLAAPEWAAARTVLLYWPVRGEVDTAALVAAALAAGKRVALPRVVRWRVPAAPPPGVWGAAGRGLALHLYGGDPVELAPGAFGILEPQPGSPPVAPGELDLVVVPGVAFDPWGGRLGYGGGYYDRFLPHVPPGVPRIGLAFSFQLWPEPLPLAPDDVRVDAVATDQGLVRCRRPA